MLASGSDAQCARLITLATPNFGSMEAVRLWWRLPLLYQGLVAVAGWQGWIVGTPGPAYLDQTIASMPSWYELTSWAGEGPLFQAQPAQAAEIYTPQFYVGANPFVSAALLTDAEAFQSYLSSAIPAGRMFSIFGVGTETAYELNPPAPPSRPEGYKYTLLGDGLVTEAQASPPGVPAFAVYGSHGLIPLQPDVWAMTAILLAGGLPSSGMALESLRAVDAALFRR